MKHLIKYKEFINESKNTDIIKKYFDECISKYFNEDIHTNAIKNSYPNFKIFYDETKAGKYDANSNTIFINRDILFSDEETKSVVYHETIHYIEYVEMPKNFHKSKFVTYKEYNERSHAGFFKETMDRINKSEGYELVKIKDTITYDKTYKVGQFYIHCFIHPENTNDIYFMQTSNINDETREFIEKIKTKILKAKDYKFFISDDRYYKTGIPKNIPSKRSLSFVSLKQLENTIPEDAYIDLKNKIENA